MATPRIFIRDLQSAQYVEGVFAIQNCQLGQTKNGKPFIKCLLADRTGRTAGRMWNASEELFNSLPTDGFVSLQGQTQAYQGEMQIIMQQIQLANPTLEELAELLPCTQYDTADMFRQVRAIIDSFEDPSLKCLAQSYLDDADLMASFQRAPAAMTLHHAFLGGLLEHTLSLLRLACALCPLYPQLNRELVLMGLFIHDLGKCRELTWETGFAYSDDGQLVGHIARGVMGLQAKADACACAGNPIPEPVVMVLHHIILSHHGKAEYGALKVPATPEAIAISMLDNFDAKMQMALAATRDQQAEVKGEDLPGHFTEKIWALDTRLYRPDPTRLGGNGKA